MLHRAQFFTIILFSLVFLFAEVNSSIASTKGITVSPAFTEVILKKGESKVTEVTIQNNTKDTVTFELFPLDFRQGGDFGEISFLGQDAESYSYSLASFLSLEANQVTVEPGQSEQITVTVEDRESLSPGGHYAAVVGRIVQESDKSDNTLISPSVSSLILVRKVGGERFNINLLDNNWPKGVAFSYPENTLLKMQNEGNVHLIPYGTFEVKDMFGRVLYSGVINSSSHIILPESRRYIQADVRSRSFSYPISINEIVIKGEDSIKKTSYSQRGTFLYVNPIALSFLGFLLLLIMIRLGKYKKRKQ